MAQGERRMTRALAWGRAHHGDQEIYAPNWPADTMALVRDLISKHRLVRGLGRSYGDSCLNFGGTLIETTRLDRLHHFDRASGLISADAGFSLFDLLRLCSERNSDGSYWFPPVLPGTKFVTLGGAIANDVHGKNHHQFGSFGSHLAWLELARSNGDVLLCSPRENQELFYATIGGLGLTGYIRSAGLQLRRVSSPLFDIEHLTMDNLGSFFSIAEDSARFEYTVAWIDCLASGDALGRGIFTRFNHCPDGHRRVVSSKPPRLSLPLPAPPYALNAVTLSAFNALYRRRLLGQFRRSKAVPTDKALFPLDGIGQWNLLYGPRGFYQYQCAIPFAAMKDGIRALLSAISRAKQGSFLAVLKTLGASSSGGLMSFPLEGATLALDFPNQGARTLNLLDRLDDIVCEFGGRIYPAKDGRISAQAFQRQYPQWGVFERLVDPNFSSSFWRRVSRNSTLVAPVQ